MPSSSPWPPTPPTGQTPTSPTGTRLLLRRRPVASASLLLLRCPPWSIRPHYNVLRRVAVLAPLRPAPLLVGPAAVLVLPLRALLPAVQDRRLLAIQLRPRRCLSVIIRRPCITILIS